MGEQEKDVQYIEVTHGAACLIPEQGDGVIRKLGVYLCVDGSVGIKLETWWRGPQEKPTETKLRFVQRHTVQDFATTLLYLLQRVDEFPINTKAGGNNDTRQV